MLRDTARNEPYREALERAMKHLPGATVMERRDLGRVALEHLTVLETCSRRWIENNYIIIIEYL